MDEKKLQEIMEDEEFVKELVQLKTKEEVQKLFKTKGLEIDINELEKLENEGKKMLQDIDLENISGGVDVKIKVASCILALLPMCPSIQAQAVSAQIPNQAGGTNVTKTAKAKDWIKKNPKKFGAAVLAAGVTAGVAIYKHAQQSKKDAALIEAIGNARRDHCARAKRLVDEGASVNARTRNGDTALINAVANEELEIVKYLVERGADVNAKNLSGNTALMQAVFWDTPKNLEIVKYLVEHGADVNARNKYGVTAYMYALPRHCSQLPEIAKYLLEHGADV